MKIETLAVAIQKDFNEVHAEMAEIHVELADIRATMATKEELKSTKEEILRAIKDLKQVVEHNDSKLSAYMTRTNEDISELQGSVKNIDVRLRVVEKRG